MLWRTSRPAVSVQVDGGPVHWGFPPVPSVSPSCQAAYDMELAKHATHAALEMDNTRRLQIGEDGVSSNLFGTLPSWKIERPSTWKIAMKEHMWMT